MTIDQRFSNMNKQISELTGLGLALTEKLSSNPGEGNNQNTASDKTCARSDRFFPTSHLREYDLSGNAIPFPRKLSQNRRCSAARGFLQ